MIAWPFLTRRPWHLCLTSWHGHPKVIFFLLFWINCCHAIKYTLFCVVFWVEPSTMNIFADHDDDVDLVILSAGMWRSGEAISLVWLVVAGHGVGVVHGAASRSSWRSCRRERAGAYCSVATAAARGKLELVAGQEGGDLDPTWFSYMSRCAW
jgi:hypothetical protein